MRRSRSHTERLLLQVLARLKRLEAHAPSTTLSIREAAELAGVPVAAARRWVRDGLLLTHNDHIDAHELLVFLRGRKAATLTRSASNSASEEQITLRAKALARGMRDRI